MAINKNHEFEELDGVKCGIVERNVSAARAEFLKSILEFNGLTVVIVPTAVKAPPAPKPVAKVPSAEGADVALPVIPTPPPAPPVPSTFTVGVTDYTFNTINAIFGRQLKTQDGQAVTLAYWNQATSENRDDIPYYETGV